MNQFVKKADSLGAWVVQNLLGLIFGCMLVFAMAIISGLIEKNAQLEDTVKNIEFRCQQLTQHANDYKREVEFADKQIQKLHVELLGEYKNSCFK
jgi:F0F1-type ATP synthase membrane subunit b/b'